MKKRILFVCWGNIHRSPIAEEIFRRDISSKGLSDKIEICSCGLQGFKDNVNPKFKNFTFYPEFIQVKKYLESLKIDLSLRVYNPISEKLVNTSDLIIAMDEKVINDTHYGLLINFPDAKEKIILFSEVSEGQKVEDPYLSITTDAYIQTITTIQSGLQKGFDKILNKLNVLI